MGVEVGASIPADATADKPQPQPVDNAVLFVHKIICAISKVCLLRCRRWIKQALSENSRPHWKREMAEHELLIKLTTDIVAAFVENNAVSPADLPGLISKTYAALGGIGAPAAEPVAPQTPAVSIRKSLQPDHLVCLEDGRKFKSLKRHLRTKYNLSPEEYRAKWGLPKDYPMVAPDYAASRSALAKSMGLGQGGRAAAAAAGNGKKKPAKAPRKAALAEPVG